MTAEYVDPIDVGITVAEREGRYAWALASSAGLTLAGVSPAGARRVDAQVAAAEPLLRHRDLSSSPVNLICPDRALAAALGELHQAIPHVELVPGSHRLTEHPLLVAARAGAHAHLDAAGVRVRRVQAGTDGSYGRYGRDIGGWGWVVDTGRFGFGRVRTTQVVVTELAAIADLLRRFDPATPMDVHLDSRHALTLVRRAQACAQAGQAWPGDQAPPAANKHLAGITALLAGRDVTFTWVRGHCGDPLNEGADRLAVHARRAATVGLDTHTAQAVARNIVAETTASLAAA